MKPQVEHAAADFLEDMAHIPDQLLQQPTFRLKRRVKGLYQVVSDLELPVASVLSLKLESPGKPSGALGQALHHPAPGGKHREQLQQQDALHSYTQAGMGLIISTLERAQVEAMILLKQTSEIPGQQGLPMAQPLASADASLAVCQSSADAERQLLADDATQHADIAEGDTGRVNDAEVRVRDVGGSLERVKNVTVNLHALTTHTLAAMEQECQNQLKAQEDLLADVIQSYQELSSKYEQTLNTAVHSSAQMHKRILRFQHLNRDQDQVIAQQETDIDSRHHAINQLQSVIACQERSDLEQKKIIAMQGKIIAALHAKMTMSQSEQQRPMPATSQTPCKLPLQQGRVGSGLGLSDSVVTDRRLTMTKLQLQHQSWD
ncbi:hypothetical protein ABBQ38_006925 [Trebouxia sp. C0009 RCD-2024]